MVQEDKNVVQVHKNARYFEGQHISETIKELYPTMSVREIADKMELPITTVRYWSTKFHLRHTEETIERLNVKQGIRQPGKRGRKALLFHGMTLKEIAIKYWSDYSAVEIVEMFGCKRNSITCMAKSLGIKHSPETTKRLARMAQAKSKQAQAKDPTYRQRQSDIHKQLYKRERWKAENGLARNTKIRLDMLPHRYKSAKAMLVEKRNYFLDASIDPMALFYDEHTVRESPKYRYGEKHYEEKYGFKFLPADDFKEEELE